jgi:hypothetical protein
MDKSTATSFVAQQHVLDNYAERAGRLERFNLIRGLVSVSFSTIFLVRELFRGWYAARGNLSMVLLFIFGCGLLIESRRQRRNRIGLEEDSRQIRREAEKAGQI